MACHFPMVAWRKRDLNPDTGKGGFTFDVSEGLYGRDYQLPCGQCIGCRLDWAADWATRCEKEASCHEANSFVTLTYRDEELPLGASTRSSVSKREFQLFMKRLRKASERPVRFFACGEYGEKSDRAHYHALLFGRDFADKRVWKRSHGSELFVSDELAALWPYGFSSIGPVNFRTAQYVAQYVVKKVRNWKGYEDREPPFVLMSRNPGIGAEWFERYWSDVYPRGSVVVGDGHVRRVPRFFAERMRTKDVRVVDEARMMRSRRVVAPGDVGLRLRAKDAIARSRLSLHSREVQS